MIKVGIIGGTGYTGIELVRLLVSHPKATIHAVSSRTHQGKKLVNYFPYIAQPTFKTSFEDLTFLDASSSKFKECDLVFFTTPHTVAMSMAKELHSCGTKIIDLSADFRLQNLKTWQEWYGQEHIAADLMNKVAYGLPEIWRSEIKQASLIANPGCYPTASILGIAPLLSKQMINLHTPVIIDAKSGVSGAGRVAQENLMYCEVNDSFSAYKLDGHRHLPEITEYLTKVAGSKVECMFAPHLVPMNRGIEASIYVSLSDQSIGTEEVFQTLTDFYKNEAFVEIVEPKNAPSTASVRGSNLCRIGFGFCPNTKLLVVTSVIDNLMKGASGQAVQNMNIIFDFEETMGLDQSPQIM